MSDISEIINLSKMIGSKDAFQNDIMEATSLISSMFRQKYIEKLERELKKQKQTHRKNPTKEIQLIQAVKPFINKERHKEIDNITDILINMTTLMDIQKDFIENEKKINEEESKKEEILVASALENGGVDPSIKEDGIYDIDETCLLSMQKAKKPANYNIFMYALLVMLIFQKK